MVLNVKQNKMNKKNIKSLGKDVIINYSDNLILTDDIDNCGFGWILKNIRDSIINEKEKINEINNTNITGIYGDIIDDVLKIKKRNMYFNYSINLVEHSVVTLISNNRGVKVYGISDKFERRLIKTYGIASENCYELVIKSIISSFGDEGDIIKMIKLRDNEYEIRFNNKRFVITNNFGYERLWKMYHRLLTLKYYYDEFKN